MVISNGAQKKEKKGVGAGEVILQYRGQWVVMEMGMRMGVFGNDEAISR